MNILASAWGLSAPGFKVPMITPQCDWANSLASSGMISNILGNVYGLVLTYLPVAVILAVIVLGATIFFAARKKVIPAVVLGLVTVLFLPTVVTALTGISGDAACTAF